MGLARPTIGLAKKFNWPTLTKLGGWGDSPMDGVVAFRVHARAHMRKSLYTPMYDSMQSDTISGWVFGRQCLCSLHRQLGQQDKESYSILGLSVIWN